MKQKIKEAMLIILAIFIIGGIIGVMYGIFSGAYSYCEGIILAKNILIMFLSGGFRLMIIMAALAIITYVGIALKILKK